MKSSRLVMCGAVLLSWVTLANAYGQEKPEAVAQKAAESWLALVDGAQYPESWDEAATVFKSQVTRDRWAEAVKQVRGPAGKLQSRKLASVNYMKDPPNVPAGEYVMIQFTTAFENVQSATETVVPMLDKDGKWRVSGYFVKKN